MGRWTLVVTLSFAAVCHSVRPQDSRILGARLIAEMSSHTVAHRYTHTHTHKGFSSTLYRVFFFTGTPPKKLKYGKPRLGEST